MDLVRAYYDHMRNNAIYDNLGITIEQAISPFKPGRIEVYVTESLDEWGRTLRIKVERVPDYDFKQNLDIPSLVKESDGGLGLIYEKAFHHYRNRPALPVDDHIVLGED